MRQEVLLDVWRNAARFDAGRGTAMAWLMTLAHRRAVDRVRSQQAATAREQRVARPEVPYDSVAETVEARLDAERVRRCLGSLTEPAARVDHPRLLRGCTYREVAALLECAGRHCEDADAGRADPAPRLPGGGLAVGNWFRRTDPHTLAGAYALDALGGADRARFERHLCACPSCSQEARGLLETAPGWPSTAAILAAGRAARAGAGRRGPDPAAPAAG